MTGVVEVVVRGGVINPGPLGVVKPVMLEFTEVLVEAVWVTGVDSEKEEDDAGCREVGTKSLPDGGVLIVEDIELEELDDEHELLVEVIGVSDGLG